MANRKIIVATLGSLGDLHPCIALALELQRRGCDPVIATSACYRQKVETCGVTFETIRPTVSMDEEMMCKILSKDGVTYFIRDVLLLSLRETYQDLSEICKNADLLIAGDLVFAAPLIAEKHRTRWVSAVLSPSSFASVYDLFPNLAIFGRHATGFVGRAMRAAARIATRKWIEPIQKLRSDLGLPPNQDALTQSRFSSQLVLALFSSCLGGPFPDWPRSTVVTGSVFYDRNERGMGMSHELQVFLDRGEPPLVFTLGSSAVLSPRSFYQESVKAAQLAAKRAVLLIGENQPPHGLSENIVAFQYEPYSELFPRAATVVQAAGAGGIAHLLRAGRPGLLLPFGAFDQPFNAARLKRLGLVRTIHPGDYTGQKAASEIGRLLNDGRYTEKTKEISKVVKLENGVQAACDAIEKLIKDDGHSLSFVAGLV